MRKAASPCAWSRNSRTPDLQTRKRTHCTRKAESSRPGQRWRGKKIGTPKGTRTPVSAVRGQRPRPLDDGSSGVARTVARTVARWMADVACGVTHCKRGKPVQAISFALIPTPGGKGKQPPSRDKDPSPATTPLHRHPPASSGRSSTHRICCSPLDCPDGACAREGGCRAMTEEPLKKGANRSANHDRNPAFCPRGLPPHDCHPREGGDPVTPGSGCSARPAHASGMLDPRLHGDDSQGQNALSFSGSSSRRFQHRPAR